MSMRGEVALLKALSDGTRFRIVEMLLPGELCVCQITPRTGRAQPTVSLQLARLERAGIVSSRREGKKVFYKIRDARVKRVISGLKPGRRGR
jgi:ArsR family transcriptional regulator